MLRRVATALGAVASACLIFLMLLTFGDVVGRYFFNAPVTFTVEITELLMGLVILLGLGLTTLKEGHITVDIVTRNIPMRIKTYLEIFSRFCTVAFLAIICWQLFEQTKIVFGDGLFTQVLGVKVYPVLGIMAVAAAFSCLIGCLVLFRNKPPRAN